MYVCLLQSSVSLFRFKLTCIYTSASTVELYPSKSKSFNGRYKTGAPKKCLIVKNDTCKLLSQSQVRKQPLVREGRIDIKGRCAEGVGDGRTVEGVRLQSESTCSEQDVHPPTPCSVGCWSTGRNGTVRVQEARSNRSRETTPDLERRREIA